MPKSLKVALTIVLALIELAGNEARAAQLEPITPRDCVTVRRVPDDRLASPMQINPQRTRVAYLVNSPNLTTNQNDVQLYMRDLNESSSKESVLVLSGTDVHDMRWLGDGTHLSVLVRSRGNLAVALVDVIKGTQTIIARLKGTDIQEYSIDRLGGTVVLMTDAATSSSLAEPTYAEEEQGYLIRPILPTNTRYHQAHLFAVWKTARSKWSLPTRLTLSSPLTHAPLRTLPYLRQLHLSLSPGGTSLLFSFLESEHIPSSWADNPAVKLFESHCVPLELTALYNLKTHETTLSLASAFVYRTPVWSTDSSSYLAVTTEAVNERPAESGTDYQNDLPPPHVYSVNKASGAAEELMSASSVAPEVLSSALNGDVVLRSGPDEIVRIRHEGKTWKKQPTLTIPIPVPRSLSYSPLASDGQHVVGDYEDAATPPEVYGYTVGQTSTQVLARLNPQFEYLRIAPTRTITWQTSDGYAIQGTLWLPPDYTEGVKYPLVIQTKPDAGDFACDSGGNHDPSFAPQPIADAGMIYLARTWPQDYRPANDAVHYPKGYPGGVSEPRSRWTSGIVRFEHLLRKVWSNPTKLG